MSSMKGRKIIKTFEGQNPPDGFEFPSITIEDIDRAVFEMFDKKINFQVTVDGASKKVPVVFASGERFALTRRKNPIRDKNNALILPIISILRNEIDFSPSQSGKGTAISFREQESYTIKYRLSDTDRKYQNIINKMNIKNQDNVASKNNFATEDILPGFASKPGTAASRRDKINNTYASKGIVNISTDLGKNIFEIIEIPYPEFVAITYDVIFWTQYMSQANEMMQTLLVKFEGQGEEITIKTKNGFDLVAFFKPPFSTSSNLDEYTETERIIKHGISLTVPGYILNPNIPGLPNLIRSYTSAPTINFSYTEQKENIAVDYQPENRVDMIKRNVLTDLTSDTENELKRGQSREKVEELIHNPFTGEDETKFSRIKSRNSRSGETVASAKISESQRELGTQVE